MRILVTGAAGFIGYHLCERLLARGDEFTGIDDLSDCCEVRKRLRFESMDIAERDFTHVDDIVEGVTIAIERPTAPEGNYDSSATGMAPFSIYNIGNSQPVNLMRYNVERYRRYCRVG